MLCHLGYSVHEGLRCVLWVAAFDKVGLRDGTTSSSTCTVLRFGAPSQLSQTRYVAPAQMALNSSSEFQLLLVSVSSASCSVSFA
eukprot:scaffold101977_cov40-Tisochrysis_lutea.AAC.3